jgi:predicted RNA-binding Zn-ribbon protein involved in translation (DUF1610 family)
MKTIFLIQLVIVEVLIIALICGCICKYRQEKKDFNNGICPWCGNQLRHFADNKELEQGWICDKCGYRTWIGWFKK